MIIFTQIVIAVRAILQETCNDNSIGNEDHVSSCFFMIATEL